MQLAQVFLHTRRLKLEGTDCAAVAVKLVSGGILNVDALNVDADAQAVLDIVQGLFDDAECLEAEEVHFDEASVLDDRAFILRT